MTVRAIFENGVFRPKSAVSLPEHAEVELAIEAVNPAHEINFSPKGMDEIYRILGTSFDDPSSPGNLAERHNEHQP
jgi:predicted DNA-binding antitoxin AbrB/MazE fold protein